MASDARVVFDPMPGDIAPASEPDVLVAYDLIEEACDALETGRLSADEAWAAAHVDEDWNTEQWGKDDEAMARRAFREAEMRAAATVLQAVPQ